LLAFHLSLMKLYGSRLSNNEAITFEKKPNTIYLLEQCSCKKKPKTIYLSS
jgi:hypothetical protein